MYKLGTKLSIDLMEGIGVWFFFIQVELSYLPGNPSLLPKITVLEKMPKKTVASSPAEVLDPWVDEGASRDEVLTQSLNRASTEMVRASRPRIYDRQVGICSPLKWKIAY
jgi:hypothetical protein